MKVKILTGIIVLSYLITTVYGFYVANYETIYSLGLYVVMATQVFGIVLFPFIYWLSKKNLSRSLRATILVISFLQVAWIIAHRINKYVPTYTISVPEDYNGMVYLFLINEPQSDVKVNNNGIGYIGHEGKAKWNVTQGSTITRNIEFNYNEISIKDTVASQLFSYEVVCFSTFDLAEMQLTPKTIDFKCIENDEFARLIDANIISEELLRRTAWKGKEGSWELDTLNSRF